MAITPLNGRLDPPISALWQKVAKSLMAPHGQPIQLDICEFQLNHCPEAMSWLARSGMDYSIIEYRQSNSYNVVFKDRGQAALFKLTWC